VLKNLFRELKEQQQQQQQQQKQKNSKNNDNKQNIITTQKNCFFHCLFLFSPISLLPPPSIHSG
jgi:hypothetical protein